MEKFIQFILKENCKIIESENIKKFYNNDFDILVYKLGKKSHSIVIDKRSPYQKIIYNNLDIALHHIKLK